MAEDQRGDASAPVVLLLFNRPGVTRQVVDRVAQARPRSVYLVADGPRADSPADADLCAEVREIATSADWYGQVHTLFAETNMGLKARVSSGLDWVFDNEDSAIILEDDCLADPSFFPFATELLHRYADNPEIGVVSGNNFLRGRYVDDYSYYFSPDVRIWGWATWSRVWRDFSQNGLNHQWSMDEARQVVSRIQSSARRQSLIREAEKVHRLNSWALPFVLHAQREDYLSIVPRENLVTNIGFGADSTHTKFESFTAEVSTKSIDFPLVHPGRVQAHPAAGALEARLEKLEWVSYPLRHPLDVLGRAWRYLRSR